MSQGLPGSTRSRIATSRSDHSDRSKTIVEPYLSKQWFVRMGDVDGGIVMGRGHRQGVLVAGTGTGRPRRGERRVDLPHRAAAWPSIPIRSATGRSTRRGWPRSATGASPASCGGATVFPCGAGSMATSPTELQVESPCSSHSSDPGRRGRLGGQPARTTRRRRTPFARLKRRPTPPESVDVQVCFLDEKHRWHSSVRSWSRRPRARPRRPGHLVLQRPLAPQHPGLARPGRPRSSGTARAPVAARRRRSLGSRLLLPGLVPGHWPRHHHPVGGPHGDHGALQPGRRARSPTCSSTPTILDGKGVR